MIKVEMIKEIAAKTGFTQKDIKSVMESIQAVTFNTLAKGDEVKLMDGVTLSTVHKDARMARNPRTGETVMVDAKNAVRCKFGKQIKEAVNA